MAVQPRKIIQGTLLPAAAATTPGLYACPSNEKVQVKKLTFANTDATARLLTIHQVASGGSASAANMVVPTVTIPAGGTYECFEIEGHILQAGDFITAFSDVANKVAVQGTGVSL